MRPRQVGIIVAFLAASLLLFLPQGLNAQSSKKLRDLVIQWFQGEVHLSVPGQQELVRVRRDTNMQVKEMSGVAIITNDGWAEYSLDSRLYVTQDSDTTLTFGSAEDAERGFVLRLSLDRGTSTFRASPGRHNAILIQASGIEVRATGKARFRIDADSDSTRVTVFDGKVQVTSAEDTRVVAKGFSLTYRAGSLTRLAQRKPSARIYSSVSMSRPSTGFSMMANSFLSVWDCGWGHNSMYGIWIGFNGRWGGWDACGWPYGWRYPHGPSNLPATYPPVVGPGPTPTPTPTPTPRLGGPGRPTVPRRDDIPRKLADEQELLTVQGESRPRAGSAATTAGTKSPRSVSTPEVLVPTVTRVVSREDAPFPRHNSPLTDRVDVTPVSRERASFRGIEYSGPSGPGGFRDSPGPRSGSGGTDRQGFNPGSGSGSSGGASPSGSSPSPSPSGAASSGPAHAPAPAAPSAPSSHPTPRSGKPD